MKVALLDLRRVGQLENWTAAKLGWKMADLWGFWRVVSSVS